MNIKPLKIVFVGGHHTPALAVMSALADEFRISNIEYQFFWIGHKYSMWKDTQPSAEYREVTALNVPFFDLKAGKFYRTYHPLKLLRLPLGLIQALYYINKIRPNLTVSFGGYLAVPVAIASWLWRIPVYTHEQSVSPGLANRLISFFARKIFISFEESQKYFPKGKTILTGNPLRPEIFSVHNPIQFPKERETHPTIYVTGGKQGGHLINESVGEILPELLEHFNVIHQCGSSTVYNDFEKLKESRKNLSETLRNGYLLKDYFNSEEIGAVFNAASFVISRSGANTAAELAALGKPAILIPIPWSSGNEQANNARILEKVGLAVILKQSDLSGEILLRTCNEFYSHIESYRSKSTVARGMVKIDAAKVIANELLNSLNISSSRA